MKQSLLSLAVLTSLTAAASAADLPRRAAPPVFTPVPVFTWTGFYVGVNAGYAFDAGNNDPATIVAYSEAAGVFNLPNLPVAPGVGFPVGGVAAFDNRSDNNGFTGGAQIGYNYQFTPGSGVVVGVEADAQYLDLGGRRNGSFSGTCAPTGAAPCFTTFLGVPTDGVLLPGGPGGLGVGATNPNVAVVNPNGLSTLDFYGTVRGRIGYAFDRVLFYGTGGFAYGSGENNINFGSKDNKFRTGYAVGGGVEYALPTDSFLNFFRSSAVTLKVEGLYVNLDQDKNNANAIVAVNTVTGATLLASDPRVAVLGGRNSTEFAVVRAGINYKFGSY